jgi:sulfoxide reductase heme-binding subunit YedZ
VIAPLGILHFWWMRAGKHDFNKPILFGVIVLLLLGMRVWWARRKPVNRGQTQRV